MDCNNPNDLAIVVVGFTLFGIIVGGAIAIFVIGLKLRDK